MIDVFMNTTTLSDGSKVYDVEVALDENGNTARFHCVDEGHASRLMLAISECVEVEPN